MFFGSPEHLKFLRYEVLPPQRRYAFLCLNFDSMLILCNILVELEHFVLFNNFGKYRTSFITE